MPPSTVPSPNANRTLKPKHQKFRTMSGLSLHVFMKSNIPLLPVTLIGGITGYKIFSIVLHPKWQA